MSIVFGYDAYRRMVADFATRTPEVLGRHTSTADLALEVDRLNILSSMDCRFTVAVVGQMRVGKSTLLNAIIGKDLAPTGVTETTATINWFRHGAGEICDKFRVHWHDGSSEDFDLSTVGEWLGDGEKAKRTQYLDFFADTSFLSTANIVDTPGTRSVIDSHEGATKNFIMDEASDDDAAAARLDTATRQQGSRADAVIYVLNPVARKKDADFLDMFGDNTRLPGASVHNSIAVIQKWEHLGDDPVAEAHKKCERIREQLEGKVAAVVPTSGLLAGYVRKLPLEIWNQVARLGCESGEDDFEDLRDSPEFFVDELDDCPLSVDQRQKLLDTIL